MNVDAQTVANELMSCLPRRWSCFSVEVINRAGASGPAWTVRAIIGPTPHETREISGIGAEYSTAIVDLHNRAMEVTP